MDFRSQLQKVVFNAEQGFQEKVDALKKDFEKVSNDTCLFVSDTLSNYNCVGINANNIDKMINAIRDYTSNLTIHLKQLKENEELNNIHSDNYDITLEYINIVSETCLSITNNLNNLKNDLLEIKKEYEKQMNKTY